MQIRRGSGQVTGGEGSSEHAIVRLSTDVARPLVLARKEGFLSKDGTAPKGFGWYVFVAKPPEQLPVDVPSFVLPEAFSHLSDGDIVRLIPKTGHISVLFQKNARHNSFLLTERCNHYCLMCSQPPRDVDDSGIFNDVMAAIPLIDPVTTEIGFTGGEPTLLGGRLAQLVRQAKAYLPRTGLHILSNGRAFTDEAFARQFAEIQHHDLMFGIPIYSDISEIHDYVVQADGAFDETIRGILNLKRHRVPVEIRVVIHKQTYKRLPELARFIARNLTFVDQVVLMGLEMTGFTKANLDDLWIDPVDYQAELLSATEYLADCRIKVSIYNHQLCITDRRLWRYARQSISDWKNEYMPECDGCDERSNCAGFFASAKLRYSQHIKALRLLPA